MEKFGIVHKFLDLRWAGFLLSEISLQRLVLQCSFHDLRRKSRKAVVDGGPCGWVYVLNLKPCLQIFL